MMEGYHLQNRAHALNVLNRQVTLPQVRLGVGDGEDLMPMKMKVQYESKKQFVVVPDPYSRSIEQATPAGQRASVTPKDFPDEGYIGEMIGGF